MEILQFSIPILCAFLVFLFMFPKKHKISQLQLPPGPRKLPFIGNLHQLIGSLPHRSLQALSKKHGSVMHLQLGEVSAIIISTAKAAKEVMKNQDLNFSDRPTILAAEITSYNGSSITVAPYGEMWRQLRKICNLEILSMKRVQSYRSIREEEVTNLVKSITSSSVGAAPINLSKMILTFMNTVVCRAAFGMIKCDEENELVLAIKEAAKLAAGFDLPDIFPSYKFLHSISRVKPAIEKLHLKIDNILMKIIDSHKTRRSSREDLVDVLLKVQESSQLEVVPITTDNIKGVILDIFGAGTETSSKTIEWEMSELIRNPRIMEKVQAEVRNILKGKTKVDETDIQDMKYMKLVIKETLRLHPPVPLIPRGTREKCKLNDYDIPIKTRIIVNAWAIGRDPDKWANPEIFDPDRFDGSLIDFKGTDFEYIPFGAGRRICPGILYGIANIELALTQLLFHFDWKLPNGTKPDEFDMSEAFGITLARKNDLILTAIPYIP